MKCVICCGGTGGHLAPGIALAEAMQGQGHQCKLVVSNKEVDSRLLRSYPHLSHVKTPGQPFSWHPVRACLFLVSHLRAVFFALRFLRREKPDVLFGFGGFSTLGMATAAFLLQIPVVLHEANRVPGRAVRTLSSIATRIYLPPGVRLRSILPKTVRYYGYPVRRGIRRISQQQARESLGFNIRGRLLLVLGGSQGAAVLNEWVEKNFEACADEGLNVVCVTGIRKGTEGVIERMSRDGNTVRAYFMPFCDNMADLLCACDLAVARAGAGSIAEFMRCRLPSILVPFPHATDHHQLLNARFHEMQGGGIVLEQEKLDTLYNEVRDMIFNEWLLASIRRNLELLDRGNSIELIVQDIEHIAAQRAVDLASEPAKEQPA